MLKTTNRYVLNTNTVNNYGYRVLSEGIDCTDYDNNPIMLWMHYRATGASTDEWLAVGVIKEIEIDADGVMTGQPYFDDTDPNAIVLYNKYENGTYNMFSILAVPVEASIEPEDMLQGQTGPTFTKSILKEISGVDIGGNAKAHRVKLVDTSGNEIKLSDEYIQSITPSKIQLTDMSKKLVESIGTLLPELKLSDAFPDSEKTAAIEGLIKLADSQKSQITTLSSEKSEALTAKKTAEDEVIKLKADTAKSNVIALVDGAIADRKILAGERENYIKLAEASFETTKAVLDKMTTNSKIQLNAPTDKAKVELTNLLKLSWNELDKGGKLIRLKELDPASFNEKFTEAFPGKEYKG